jgi:hypothetical protein
LLLGVSAVAVVLEDISAVLVEVDTSTSEGASGVQPSEKVKATATHRLKTFFTGSNLRWVESLLFANLSYRESPPLLGELSL